jgi:hypothetical protein
MSPREVPTNDHDLGFLELKKSSVFAKIPQTGYSDYVDRSLDAGARAAEEFIGRDIRDVLKEYDIKIEQGVQKSKNTPVRLRADINFSKKHTSMIRIYEDSIRSIARDCNPAVAKKFRLSPDQIVNVHLAHEFFHYLEFLNDDPVSAQLPKVQIFKILGWKYRVDVVQCSEIAANAFAKSVCGTRVLPNYYDFIYLAIKEDGGDE